MTEYCTYENLILNLSLDLFKEENQIPWPLLIPCFFINFYKHVYCEKKD